MKRGIDMNQAPDEKFFKNAAEAAANANIPKRIKIDLETPLEIFFLVCFCLACLGVVITTVATISSYAGGKGDLYALSALGALIALAAFMLKCKRETDNYYVLDTIEKKLLYHYKFFSDIKITTVADFGDIKCLAVGGTRAVNKGQESWTYHIYAVDKKGVRTYLSNVFIESGIEENNKKCAGIAEVIGCAHIAGEPRKALLIKGLEEGGDISVTLAEHDAAGLPHIKNMQPNVKKLLAIVLLIELIVTLIVVAFFVLRMK
jgi:hypothetical protein